MWPCLPLFSLLSTHNSNSSSWVWLYLTIVPKKPHFYCARIHMPIVLRIMKAITLWNVPGTSHCAHFSAHLKFFGLPKFLQRCLIGHNGMYLACFIMTSIDMHNAFLGRSKLSQVFHSIVTMFSKCCP